MTDSERATLMRGHAKDYYRQARYELSHARVCKDLGYPFERNIQAFRSLRHKARIHRNEAINPSR